MSYYISKTIKKDFNSAIDHITDTFMEIGFGVVSRINLNEKFKEKLDIDFRKYTILGVCNPGYAYEALQLEDKVGTMLPCSLVVQEVGNGEVEVAVIDPVESMEIIKNDKLKTIMEEVKEMLETAVEKL